MSTIDPVFWLLVGILVGRPAVAVCGVAARRAPSRRLVTVGALSSIVALGVTGITGENQETITTLVGTPTT